MKVSIYFNERYVKGGKTSIYSFITPWFYAWKPLSTGTRTQTVTCGNLLEAPFGK